MANKKRTGHKLNVKWRKCLSQLTVLSLSQPILKSTSYEDKTKGCVKLKNALTLVQISEIVLPSRKFKNKSKLATSGVTTYGLFHSFCFNDKLQNYHKAGQNLRYSIAFYQKFVAVSQLEI